MSWHVSNQHPPHKTQLKSCCYIKVYILPIFKHNSMIKRKSWIKPSLQMLKPFWYISIILHCFKSGNSIFMLQRMLFPVSRPYAMSELWGGGVPTSNSWQFSALDSGCPARILLAWQDKVNPNFNDKGQMNGYIGNDNNLGLP